MFSKLRFSIDQMKRFFFLLILWLGLVPALYGQETETVELKKDASAYEKANSEYLLIDAQKHILLEDFEKAMALLDQAIDVDKLNHAAYLKKSEILVLQESFDLALIEIEKAITLKPDNLYYYVWAVQIQKQQNEPEKIADLYALMLNNCSGYEKYGIEIINAFSEVDRNKQALDLIEELKIFYPNYPELYLKKAELEMKEGKERKSKETITTAQSLFPKDPTILLLHVKNLTSQGKSEDAITLLKELDKSFIEGQILLIEAYSLTGQTEQATSLALELIENEDSSLESKLLTMSYLQDDEDNYALLDSIQQQFESQYNNSPLVFENGGLIYSRMSKNNSSEKHNFYAQRAINSYKSLALLDPNNFDTWLRVFEYEMQRAQWNDLLNDVEYLLDLYPNQSILFYYYSEAYRGLDDLDEAIGLIDQGLRMSGRNELLKSLMLSQKGRILVDQDKGQEADQVFNQALSSDKIDERAIYYYANWLAEVNPNGAKELMDVFSEAISPSIRWKCIEIKVKLNEGKVEEARSDTENLIASSPNNLDGNLLELFGDILFQLGSTDEALEQWKKALNLGGFSKKLEDKIANKAYN